MAAPNQFPGSVSITEVGPRDGLQREAVLIPTERKAALIADLVEAGLKRIQVTSFVHPQAVPQMADAEEVCRRLPNTPDVTFSGLALNLKGVERAQAAGLSQIDISLSASAAHSLRNANRTIEQALIEFREMHSLARAAGMGVRGGIQCAFGYQHAGDVAPSTIINLTGQILALGVDELAVADSAGLANPLTISALLDPLMRLAGEVPVTLHLHDTRGMGLANVLASLRSGVSQFDSAFGGLGGCPFIDGAAGNIATEDTVHMLEAMGISTGIDLGRVARISKEFEQLLGKPLPGKVYALVD